MVKDEKLDFWIKHRRNVLFVGKHGVGKTSKAKAAFDRAKLFWKYFSAATMDPWVDFIGVPRAIDIGGGKQILELVRPREFADDLVQAIFFDELNRSHPKVRNAVMELLQFKSINGRKFNNLQFIWAAVNPDDEDRYDVEKMDDAQVDRFHIHVEIPYKCDRLWFTEQFGTKIATAAISWWDALPADERDKVSPRRLEYALNEAAIGGDMRDVLPDSANVSKLITTLQLGPIDQVIKALLKSNDRDQTRSFLANENNYISSIEHILKNEERMKFFLPLISVEKLASLIPTEKKVLDFVINESTSTPTFAQVLSDVYDVNKDNDLRYRIEKLCESTPQEKLPEKLRHLSTQTNGISKPMHGKEWKKLGRSWKVHVDALKAIGIKSTHDRRHVMREIERYMPPTLTEEEAKDTLELLNLVAQRSYPGTLKRSAAFIPLANHCCQQLESLGTKPENMYTKYKNELSSIRKKLHAMDKAKQFYIPI